MRIIKSASYQRYDKHNIQFEFNILNKAVIMKRNVGWFRSSVSVVEFRPRKCG